jgi:hypothetical protein
MPPRPASVKPPETRGEPFFKIALVASILTLDSKHKPDVVLDSSPHQWLALTRPFFNGILISGDRVRKPSHARLALTQYPKCVPQVILSRAPLPRRVLARRECECRLKGCNRLNQSGIVATLFTVDM